WLPCTCWLYQSPQGPAQGSGAVGAEHTCTKRYVCVLLLSLGVVLCPWPHPFWYDGGRDFRRCGCVPSVL
ncbi:unnamed protein product, partial [Bubo scandiacus]